eukprot:9515855-Prorocentrum_lima.AAC.1
MSLPVELLAGFDTQCAELLEAPGWNGTGAGNGGNTGREDGFFLCLFIYVSFNHRAIPLPGIS